MVYEYQNGIFGGYRRKRIPNRAIVKLVEDNPGLVESSRMTDGLRNTGLTGGEVTGLHYIFSDKDSFMANEFFERLSSGANLVESSPILKLKTRLAQAKTLKAYTIDKRVRVAFTIKAWNAYRKGRTLKQLRFVPSGSTKETFPIPL